MTQSEFFHHGDRRSFPISSPGQTPPIGAPCSTWRPADLVVSKNAISIDRATEEINGRNMLAGKENRSGVTIGVGVDPGQQTPETYKDRLRNFGIKQELIAKLEPYMGLIRGQAIEKLKEKPLSLSKQEVEQIVAEMKNEMLKGLIREYKDLTKDIKNHREFKEPAIQEQTILGKMEA